MSSMSHDMERFVDACLVEHNLCRRDHGGPPLRHSLALDRSAQDWAHHLIQSDQLTNSPLSTRGDVGENISMRSSTAHQVDLTGKEVVDKWYADIKNYNFNTGTGPAGNFTQLVWLDTREVGFGKASAGGKCVVVAHYRPPGNVLGRYLENVRPLGYTAGAAEPATGKQAESTSPSSSNTLRKTKETVETEKCVDDEGQMFELRRKIIEYTDEDGNVTEKIEESNVYDTMSMNSTGSTPDDPCHSIDDNEFEKRLKTMSDEEKQRKWELRKFTNECLDAHNTFRVRHGCHKLVLNNKLSEMAQTWADYLVTTQLLSNSGHIYKGGRLGENIGSRWSNGLCDYTGREIVDHWYSEEKKYNYDVEPSNVQGIGNFSQMIWEPTREIGIGKAVVSKKGSCKVVVVAHYHPCGNILQCFKDNIPKPVSQ